MMIVHVVASDADASFVQPHESLGKEESTTAIGTSAAGDPLVTDPRLEVELVYEGLDYPTNMAFLASNDILVLEKNKGTIQRIIDGQMLEQPVLDVAVANENERG